MDCEKIAICLTFFGVLCVAGMIGGYAVHYFASPDLSARVEEAVVKLGSRVNATDGGTRRVCSRVPWEVTEYLKRAEKMLQRDYERALQHHIHKLKEELSNTTVSLCEALTDTKMEIQSAALKKTEDKIALLVNEAMDRVHQRFETRLQEMEEGFGKRQDGMDQRLSLEPQIMEIRGFIKWDTFYPILLLQVLFGVILMVCVCHSPLRTAG